MRRMTVKILVPALLCLLPLQLQAFVGRVIFTHGPVTVERPAPDVLTKGMPVDAGDVIVTGAKGYAQILLDDGTKIAIRPDSRFTIVALEGAATAGSPAIGGGTAERTEFSLQKGGFRTLTGSIASRTPGAYRVSTPNAVIGIRGTNYVARLCSGDCGAGTNDGLFVGVSNGAIYLSNNGGELDLARNQYGYARNFNTTPVRLIAPPPTLQDEGLDVLLEEEEEEESTEEQTASAESGDEGDGEGEGDAEEAASEFGGDNAVAESDASATETSTAAGGSSGPDQEISATTADGSAIDLTDGGSTPRQAFSFSTEQGALGTVTATGGLVLNDAGGLAEFSARGSDGATESWSIGTASEFNVGFDPNSNLKWGRWGGGVASVNGTDVDLTSSSLHYVLAEASDAPSQVITGSASYVLVGNTDPTDNQGNVGVLGSASLFADFTNATVESDLQLSINNQVWGAQGSGSITSNLFNGLYDTVTVNGSAGGSGSFGGLFTGFADLIPVGAALNYNLVNGSQVVNGAVIFNRAGSQ